MKKKKKILKNEKGMAIIETLPLLVIFVLLSSYGIGFWGSIHTGILHSIAARTYAFETFRNRTNLTYFREDIKAGSNFSPLYAKGFRFHAIQSRRAPQATEFFGTKRKISIGPAPDRPIASSEVHNINIHKLSGRNRKRDKASVDSIWVMVGYGMCINVGCTE